MISVALKKIECNEEQLGIFINSHPTRPNILHKTHWGELKLHLQSRQFVGLNQTAGEVSTPWKLADIIAHLSLQTASTWLSSIVQTFNHQKKTKKNINHWKNNFNNKKKITKILTIKKIISMVEKKTTKILIVKKIISMVEKKQKKNQLLKKKCFFFVFFFWLLKNKAVTGFLFCFSSLELKKRLKRVFESEFWGVF